MRKITYIFSFVFLASCTGNTIYKKPKNLIPKDTMFLLLTDMYIASSAKYNMNKNNERDVNYMPLIYEKYKIDSLRFQISNNYYTSKMEEYEEVLKMVKKELDTQKFIVEKQIKLKDSIEDIKEETVDLDSLGIGKIE